VKIICLSDTHGYHDEVVIPDGDILIHCGDYSARGSLKDITKFALWLGTLPHKHKIIISGNHDIYADGNRQIVETIFAEQDAVYLENELYCIEGLQIYGSPITPQFCSWAFMRKRGNEIAQIWQDIPKNLDILVTHGPPYGILDTNRRHMQCGCWDLGKRITERKPKYHLFGHLHEAYGQKQVGDTLHINCSVLDDYYDLVNPPVILEI
jgi:Icc-related predicted phosphoesterase